MQPEALQTRDTGWDATSPLLPTRLQRGLTQRQKSFPGRGLREVPQDRGWTLSAARRDRSSRPCPQRRPLAAEIKAAVGTIFADEGLTPTLRGTVPRLPSFPGISTSPPLSPFSASPSPLPVPFCAPNLPGCHHAWTRTSRRPCKLLSHLSVTKRCH